MPNVPEKEVAPRTVTIQGTEVLIDPQTNRPQAGSIVGQGAGGARKVLWQESDVRARFPMVDWFNYGEARNVTFNGVRINFGFGWVRTPSIARDMAYDSYNSRRVTEDALRQTGLAITTGQLEPRR